jgi:hypothetical protein
MSHAAPVDLRVAGVVSPDKANHPVIAPPCKSDPRPSRDSAHPGLLVFPALAAHTAVHVGRVGAVLKVAPTSCGEGRIQLLGPFLVGLS